MLETALYLNETADAGIHVVALVRNYEKAMRRLGHLAGRKDLTLVVQDVRAPYSGPEAIDFLIHAASQASPRFFGSDPVGTFETNVVGTQRMLQVAWEAHCEGFLFFSSGEIYGRQENPSIPITETSYGYLDPVDLRSCYAEGKRGGETLCASGTLNSVFPQRSCACLTPTAQEWNQPTAACLPTSWRTSWPGAISC